MLFINWKVAKTFQSQDMKMLITRKWGVESCWELDAEDLENIKNNGGRVYLYIQGAVVPPVLLTTESMVFFKEGDEQNENDNTK